MYLAFNFFIFFPAHSRTAFVDLLLVGEQPEPFTVYGVDMKVQKGCENSVDNIIVLFLMCDLLLT